MKKTTFIVFIFLSLYFCIFGAQKINLTAADIGRHVKNGDLILHASSYGIQVSDILHTNFFSYTEPNFPFINHHWGSGVLSYLVYSVSGWDGLSLVYIFIFLCTLYLVFSLAIKKSSLLIAAPITIFLIPLIAERTEVRPEVISYFFIYLFIYILHEYTNGALQKKYLWILPLVMLVWVNLHIYFIFGFFVLGAFSLETLIQKNWSVFKMFVYVGCACLVTALINPFGFHLLYYPFTILNQYGYLVAENQSISFLERLNFTNPNFLWWKLTAILLIISLIISTFVSKKDLQKKFPFALTLICIVFAYLSYTAIRNLSLFGLIAVPLLADYTKKIFDNIPTYTSEEWRIWTYTTVFTGTIIIFSCIHFSSRLPNQPGWGIGLLPRIMGSSEFIKNNHIFGPFFNNYDIGGYLIFAMYPEKLFVDNRPETYSTQFFQNEYIPAQEDMNYWKKEEEKYNFNVIWFYRLDMAPWAQQFLIEKIDDPEWVPVFTDDYTIIFIKNTPANKEIISKYTIPRSMFTVTH